MEIILSDGIRYVYGGIIFIIISLIILYTPIIKYLARKEGQFHFQKKSPRVSIKTYEQNYGKENIDKWTDLSGYIALTMGIVMIIYGLMKFFISSLL